MATAKELLAAYTSDVDKTLVISNDLRTIAIPNTVRNLGVESDDEVLRLHFKMPRYIGDIDLSAFSTRINYLNAEGEGDVYMVDDAVITEDTILFSWLVGPTATAYKGDTHFNVCMKIVNDEGYIEREYNTTPAVLPVLKGLETDERALTMYSDILEQWKRDLFGIGDTVEARIVAKGNEVLESVSEIHIGENGNWWVGKNDTGTQAQGEQGEQGERGDPGHSGVYVGSNTPPEGYNVWIDPSGQPTSTEDWEFDLEDGTTEIKTVVVVS